MRTHGVLILGFFLFSILPVGACAGDQHEGIKSTLDTVTGMLEAEEPKKPENSTQRRAGLRPKRADEIIPDGGETGKTESAVEIENLLLEYIFGRM